MSVWGTGDLDCLLARCGATGSDQIGTPSVTAVETAVTTRHSRDSRLASRPAATSSQLRFAPGDKIWVTVFGEDKLSGEYQIDSSGTVSLPLAGTIEAAGLTKPELEQALTAKLKSEYLT